jgi:hypothetical protein
VLFMFRAATDPGHAASLFSDAERVARSITDKFLRAQALAGIAEVLISATATADREHDVRAVPAQKRHQGKRAPAQVWLRL